MTRWLPFSVGLAKQSSMGSSRLGSPLSVATSTELPRRCEFAIAEFLNDPERMNQFMQDVTSNPSGDLFIPQHHYVFDDGDDDGAITRRRIVTHVLEFDRLNEEFDALMECYSIMDARKGHENETLAMPPANARAVNGRIKNAGLTRANLTEESIRAINEYFREDFELLGYPMM